MDLFCWHDEKLLTRTFKPYSAENAKIQVQDHSGLVGTTLLIVDLAWHAALT